MLDAGITSEFLAFRTIRPLLVLIRLQLPVIPTMTSLAGSALPGSAGILPAVFKNIRAPARSLH